VFVERIQKFRLDAERVVLVERELFDDADVVVEVLGQAYLAGCAGKAGRELIRLIQRSVAVRQRGRGAVAVALPNRPPLTSRSRCALRGRPARSAAADERIQPEFREISLCLQDLLAPGR